MQSLLTVMEMEMKGVDHVQIVQDYVMSDAFSSVQTFALLERLEPVFEAMYDAGLTKVVPVRDLQPLHEMFSEMYI